MTRNLKFTGAQNFKPKKGHDDIPKTPEPYIAEEDLIKAINLAIFLKRPLLLEGEAGCGKTRLARAVAYELGLPYYRWDIRSTTKAQEGLYEYDAILRLHDVQLKKAGGDIDLAGRDPSKPENYITYGALGKAFQVEDRQAVVLIDEIDKGHLDFPNDLLAVLDEPWEFYIKETDKIVTAKHQPIVIITSNKEKGNLPKPFLRRCLYHFMEFPQEDRLREIVNVHYDQDKTPDTALVGKAIAKFNVERDKGLHKRPGTSEFLDWVKALNGFTAPPYETEQLEKDNYLPYPELIYKLKNDWLQFTPRRGETQ